jgi:phosphatidate cytidylyltransferase
LALDKKTFRTRAITALVFVAIMLVGLLFNMWSFLLLFSIIMVGCLVEYVKLLKKISPVHYKRYLLTGVFYIVVPVLMIIDLGFGTTLDGKVSQSAFSISQNYFPLLPCAIILSIWINDTMAYIVGSLIGKTPFSKISPKKTWEGTGGGALLCVVFITILSAILDITQQVHIRHWIAIATLSAIFGTIGDLLESKLKREAMVKDSGSFMPGHGGFLDRFDSLLIATPAVWLYVRLFL